MDFRNVHMVGIGGIGMSALAQLFIHEGKVVTGSDREESPTTELLEKKGVSVHIGHLETLPKESEVVIYSDAIPEDNSERKDAAEKNIPQISYFDALGEISKNKFTITVSGSHGKTTTTGMLGKLLVDAQKDPTVVVGSIMKDFGSNFVAGGDLFVVEGCEYKDHLLSLNTNVLVITNIEFDHPDHFKDLKHVQDTFKKAIKELPKDGIVVTNPSDPNITPILKDVDCKVIDYTKEDLGELILAGEFNEMNAKAALSAGFALDSDLMNRENAIKSIATFLGTWRRLDNKGKTKSGAIVYDDYAHHPSEVVATLNLLKNQLFKSKNIVVAFHPHLVSRTRVFFDEFVDALAIADRIVLAPIYKARNESEDVTNSKMLAKALKEKGKDAKYFETFDEIQKELEETTGKDDLIVTMGAGDIYKVADKLVL